jgi:hypothetical protein
MRPALTKGDLAEGLRRILSELEADPDAAGYELAFEVCPGVPWDTPSSDALQKRRRRARSTPPNTPPLTPPNTPPPRKVAESAPGLPAAIRPAPAAPSDHARGHQNSDPVSGSGPERSKEYAAVAKEPDRSSRAQEAAAAAMTADWIPPETLLTQLEMMPGIPRVAGLFLLRRAALHFAQDEGVRKTPAQWRQIMSRWACSAWTRPQERAAAMAAVQAPGALPQVGGFHEGPVQRLDPPAEWTRQARAERTPPPPELLAILERARAQHRLDRQAAAGGLPPENASAPDVDGARGKIGGER